MVVGQGGTQASSAGGLEDIRSVLRCPRCRSSLRWSDVAASCPSCGSNYPIEGGVTVLVASDRDIHDDELDHDHGHHKGRQAAWFDDAQQVDFEIERPRGTPALYEWFLREKARRALDPIGRDLVGMTAFVICGGSGMDAEFLAERGAQVITSDISIGAAQRAAERSRRHGVPFLSIVADAEQLPLDDASIDLLYVHDGLHHLAEPDLAIAEMTRASGRWLAITEPARAGLTRIAVRLGLALDREPAGNRVIRFEPARLAARIETAGFVTVRADRYAMLYRHLPGRTMTWLSRPVARPAVVAGYRLIARLLGRAGNKLVVVGRRP